MSDAIRSISHLGLAVSKAYARRLVGWLDLHRTLHGWHYVIEEGEVHVFDLRSGSFVPASDADHSGTGPFDHAPVDDGSATSIFNEIDEALGPARRGAAQG